MIIAATAIAIMDITMGMDAIDRGCVSGVRYFLSPQRGSPAKRRESFFAGKEMAKS